MWFRSHHYSISNISPVVINKKSVIKHGCPVTNVEVKIEPITLNSNKVLSKLPRVNQHALEIAIDTKQPLKEVSSKIFEPSDDTINSVIESIEAEIGSNNNK